MLKTFLTFLFFSSIIFCVSCEECDNENPRARVTNMSEKNIDVTIQIESGAVNNIKNIEPGKSSRYTDYSPGNIIYSIISKNNKNLAKTVEMDFCTDYEILIQEDLTINVIVDNRE